MHTLINLVKPTIQLVKHKKNIYRNIYVPSYHLLKLQMEILFISHMTVWSVFQNSVTCIAIYVCV